MLGKVKVEQLLMYNGAAEKTINWVSPIGQYLDIVGVTNGKMHAKFAVTLFEGKGLTWWCMFS